MVTKYNLEEGNLTFTKKLHVLNEDKSIALLSIPFPPLREMEVNNTTELEVIVRKI